MRCRSCGEAGHLHRAHSRTRLERVLKPLLPYRRFVCHQCGALQVRWVGFAYHRRQRRRPIWMLILATLGAAAGWYGAVA